MESKVKFITGMPDEIIARARNVLYFREAIQSMLREFMKESAKNYSETAKLWSDVEKEAQRLGIVKAQDEIFTFDYITDTFMLVKIDQKPGS